MARFKYLGEPVRPGITYGPCTSISLRKSDGTLDTLTPKPPSTQFTPGQDIGYVITDSMELLVLRGDRRFQEIV